ncbi:MAG: NAD(P)H-binding protein [Armatimonadetes bacterium]|nr:NAD(P)H-binding protein [Armatimonadota bacterium]
MNVVVIGGTGLIGSKLVKKLGEHGHAAIAASPDTGVNTLTTEGLDEALRGADVVIDVSNSPTYEARAVMDFFTTSTQNLLLAEKKARVKHHVLLSIVGTDRLADSAVFRAKMAQEDLIRNSGLPYSIVHATQFFEFVKAIAADSTQDDTVRLAPVLIQPMSSDDVASALGQVAVGAPLNGDVEVAGPKEWRLDDLVRKGLSARNDPRQVMSDPKASYFGARLDERTLLPAAGAKIFETRFEDWLATA